MRTDDCGEFSTRIVRNVGADVSGRGRVNVGVKVEQDIAWGDIGMGGRHRALLLV